MAELIISGPAGRIEARYVPAPGDNPPIALILLWTASQRLKMETPERRLALAIAAGEPAAA